MSANNRKRWIVAWKNSRTKPAIYHCISRVVGRDLVLGVDEREHFRMLMRMCEKFTGCRVLSYCVMSNHFHLLLEVTPQPAGGIKNDELLSRLGAFYSKAQVAEVMKEMEDAAFVRKRGEFELPPLDEKGVPLNAIQEIAMERQQAARRVEAIHRRYTRRMHDLSEFMKSLLERFTKWYNRTHSRSGTLWEDRFKSVIVESGVTARTIAAYIDLNPVRARMVKDPADYRWSSYGEAVGGGKKGNGKKAREGLVRAFFCDQGVGFESEKWQDVARLYRRHMGMALERKPMGSEMLESTKNLNSDNLTRLNTIDMLEIKDDHTAMKDLSVAKMLHCRVRYFSDGAVIGSKEFVNEAFDSARERFGPKRKDGARPLRGIAKAAKGTMWSMRDLRQGT